MLLQLAADGEPLLLEEREFRQFAVRLAGEWARPLSVKELSSALGPLGLAEDSQLLWLNVRRLAMLGPDEDEWRLRYYEMIEYAGSKGWLRNNGSEVRLHIAP